MIYIIKVWKLLQGYAIIRLTGFNVSKLINKLCENDISVYNLHKYQNGRYYEACISRRYINKIISIAEKYSCNVTILHSDIYSVFLNNLRYKICFISGIILFIIFIFYLSSIIWIIDIKGNYDIETSNILRYCSSLDLYVGNSISKINGSEIAENLQNNFKNISWVNVSTQGTKVQIKLAEGINKSNSAYNNEPSDIVSTARGIVTDIVAKKGTPLVKKGDVVNKGDILISGYLKNSGSEEIEINEVVKSIGTVRAEIERDYSFTIPLMQQQKVYTGKEKNKYRLKLWNTDIADNDAINYKSYDYTKTVKQIKLKENIPLPIIVYKYIYREYSISNKIIGEEEAKAQANKNIINYIIENYPTSANIISINTDFNIKDNILYCSSKIISDEEIGCQRMITQTGGQILNDSTEAANTR